ncbi:hypothetical protein [Virgibacillus pantothenticus]|nr:hypothetical protein [Virgibacillus pantothenticus]
MPYRFSIAVPEARPSKQGSWYARRQPHKQILYHLLRSLQLT